MQIVPTSIAADTKMLKPSREVTAESAFASPAGVGAGAGAGVEAILAVDSKLVTLTLNKRSTAAATPTLIIPSRTALL